MPTDITDRNQVLIIKRLERDRNQSIFQIENQEIRLLELEEESIRIRDDIENHRTRIAEMEGKIKEQKAFAATLPTAPSK